MIFAVLSAIFTLSLSAETLVVAVHGTEASEIYERTRLWLDLLESETQLRFTMESMSLDRARQQMLAGEVDMDFGRSARAYTSDEAFYIEPPLSNVNYYIYTAEKDWRTVTLEDLKKGSVALPLGNIALNQWADKEKLNCVLYPRTQEASLLSLLYGRASYVIDSLSLINLLDSNEKFSSRIHRKEEPIFNAPVYIVLSKRSKEWAPVLSRGIEKLGESGRGQLILPR